MSKRGISVPWNFAPEDFTLYIPAFQSGKLSWVSNWEMWKPQGLPADVLYIPQCRTAKEADQIGAYLHDYHKQGKLESFIGFNEPDILDQANMSASQGVDLWKKHVLPMKEKCHGVRVGSPAVSNGENGIQWLHDFFGAMGGVKNAGVDHIVIHFYGPDAGDFKKYVENVYHTFNLPVWVTEFACTRWDPANPTSDEEVLNFMKETVSFMDASPFVHRYAWFGAMKDVGEGVGRANGLQNDSQLSALGHAYVSI
jgi:hypothetical protein